MLTERELAESLTVADSDLGLAISQMGGGPVWEVLVDASARIQTIIAELTAIADGIDASYEPYEKVTDDPFEQTLDHDEYAKFDRTDTNPHDYTWPNENGDYTGGIR